MLENASPYVVTQNLHQNKLSVSGPNIPNGDLQDVDVW